jgi:hypothetical protein
MNNVACFCGCLYSFDGDEGPCPKCGTVAVIRTRASTENREENGPDAAVADASLYARMSVPSGR